MSVRRALVDCSVLSLQDACLFYPSCKGCLSRVDVEHPDTTRCRCSKCGYSCSRELVDYRYRLSLKVTRDGSLFGVTVFGTCLNPFFGIHATGLQRLVQNFDGPVEASVRSTLLLTAVKDCFIGRHFIFGIKVTEKDNWPCFAGPVVKGSSSKDTVQVIATQMMLPKATGLEGCTVISYYRILLQKAAEYELGSTSRPPATTLLLIAHHSPASSFNNVTLCSSGLSSQSLLRSQHQDCTLTHTPPWQQSPGLVTSSAEQEDGCSTQDFRDETSRETDNFKTPQRAQRRCQEDHKVTEASMVLSPLPSLESSSHSHSSTAKYPHPSFEKAVGNTPIFNPCFSPSTPGHNCSKRKRFSTRQPPETFSPSSLAWEDLPFSESLTAFLCDENKAFDNVSETELDGNVQNQIETVRNNLEIRSHDKHSSAQSASVCQSNTQITDTHSQMLLDITNTSALNGGGKHELSEQVHQKPAGSVDKSRARNMCPHECNREDEKVRLLSFENADEQLDGDTFNCSADLFSGSLIMDIADTLNTHVQTIRTTPEAGPVLSKPDKQHLRSEKANVPHSTTDKQILKSRKCINRYSLVPSDTQDDFIPPSQSTPIVKVAVVSGSPASSYRSFAVGEFSSQPDSHDSSAFHRKLLELDSRRPTKAACSLCKLNCVGADQRCQCSQKSTAEKKVCTTSSRHRFTPKRRSWKPNKHKTHPLTQQRVRVQGEALNTGSTGRIKCDSSECDVTACDYEDSEETIVPPTPAAKTCQSVKLKGRNQTDESSSGGLGFTGKGQQRHEAHCKRTLMDQILLSSQRDLAQTGNCDSETVDEGRLDGSNSCLLDDEEEAVDWSRDLFSDSI